MQVENCKDKTELKLHIKQKKKPTELSLLSGVVDFRHYAFVGGSVNTYHMSDNIFLYGWYRTHTQNPNQLIKWKKSKDMNSLLLNA